MTTYPWCIRLIDPDHPTNPLIEEAYECGRRPTAERIAADEAKRRGLMVFDVYRLSDQSPLSPPAPGEYVPDTDPAVDVQVSTHLDSIAASMRDGHSTLRTELAMYRAGLANHLREGSSFFAESYRRIIAALES